MTVFFFFDIKVTENDLYKVFSRFGEILSLKIAYDEHKRSKGYGYVCFREPKQALLAIENMHNQLLAPGKKRLNVTIWQPKEARISQLFASYHSALPFALDPHHSHPPHQQESHQNPYEFMMYPGYFPPPPMMPGVMPTMLPFPNYYYQGEDNFIPFIQERKASPPSNLKFRQENE